LITQRDSIILKKNATLKTLHEKEEEITLQTLEKDIERQTNFNYNPEIKHKSMANAFSKNEDWNDNTKFFKLKKAINNIHYDKTSFLRTNNNFSKYSNLTNNLSQFYSNEPSFSKEKQKFGKLFEINQLEKLGIGKKGRRILPKIKDSSLSSIHNFVHAL
jgi:hypothetical protein